MDLGATTSSRVVRLGAWPVEVRPSLPSRSCCGRRAASPRWSPRALASATSPSRRFRHTTSGSWTSSRVGCPSFGGCSIVVDATLRSPFSSAGAVRFGLPRCLQVAVLFWLYFSSTCNFRNTSGFLTVLLNFWSHVFYNYCLFHCRRNLHSSFVKKE